MTSSRTIAVIVPAKDEAAVIRHVLLRIPRQIDGMAVISIVVDDGSSDATAAVAADCGAYVLRHLTNRGVDSWREHHRYDGWRRAARPRGNRTAGALFGRRPI